MPHRRQCTELVDEHPITRNPILHAPRFKAMPLPVDLGSFPVEKARHIRYRHNPAHRGLTGWWGLWWQGGGRGVLISCREARDADDPLDCHEPLTDSQAMTNILFICGKARKRSPTAAAVAAERLGQPTDFAGLSADADERVGPEQLAWADTIAVMEKAQLSRLKRQLGSHLKGKHLVCLDIPDSYEFMQPELVELVVARLGRIVR